MAVVVETKLVCDKCASMDHGKVTATSTRRFGKDGQNYELEVCDKHGDQLDRDIDQWVRISRRAGTKARVLGRTANRGARAATTAKKGMKYDPADVRTWAKLKGYNVSDDPAKRLNPRILRQYLDEMGEKASA